MFIPRLIRINTSYFKDILDKDQTAYPGESTETAINLYPAKDIEGWTYTLNENCGRAPQVSD